MTKSRIQICPKAVSCFTSKGMANEDLPLAEALKKGPTPLAINLAAAASEA